MLSANARGTLWVLSSALAYAVSAAVVRALSGTFDAGVQNFARQLVALALVLPAIVRTPRLLCAVSDRPLMIFRSVAQSLGFVLTYYSFQTIPLLDATVLSFTRILWVYVLAALFLGERLTVASGVALALGTIGGIVTLHPDTIAFGAGHLAALVGAFVLAVTNVSVARLSQGTSLTTLLAWTAIAGLMMTAPFAATAEWATPRALDIVLLLAGGVAAVAAQLAFVIGMKTGQGSVVATADYARLPFAALLAYAVFGEAPEPPAIAGGALIILGSLVPLLWPARRIARDQP